VEKQKKFCGQVSDAVENRRAEPFTRRYCRRRMVRAATPAGNARKPRSTRLRGFLDV